MGNEIGPCGLRSPNGRQLVRRKLLQGLSIVTIFGLQLASVVIQFIGVHGLRVGRVVGHGESELAPFLLGIEPHQLDSKIGTEPGFLNLGPAELLQHVVNAVR